MNMRKILVFAVVAVLSALIVSCGNSVKRQIKQGLYRCDDRLQTAMRHMERGKFSDAVRVFEEVRFQCGGSPMMDTVYFNSGVANFRMKQYEDARFDFETLFREFPRSPFADEAHFRLAYMSYIRSLPSFRDQTETKEAMRLFNDYAGQFPEGAFADSARILYMSSLNKLAEKAFNTARFYRKQRQHEAALIYYRAVLSEYPDSRFAPESIIGMAEMMVALGRTEEAAEVIGELDPEAFEEELRERIKAVKQRLSS